MILGVIYVITNLLNDMKYVGQTRQKLGRRISQHKRGDLYVDKAIQKYGLENFSVEVLEECETQEQLNAREIFWIAEMNCMMPKGYNRNAGGGGQVGYVASAETCAKISAANTKRYEDPAERAKTSEAMKGIKKSPETRAKLSESLTGRPRPKEVVEKLIIAAEKRFSDPAEHEKLSRAALKRFEDPAEHEKLSRAHIGKKDTDEIKANKSAAQKKRWTKRREKARKIAEEMFIFLTMIVLAIQNDTPTLATGMDGLMSIVIADAARKSAEENRPVKISELMPKL